MDANTHPTSTSRVTKAVPERSRPCQQRERRSNTCQGDTAYSAAHPAHPAVYDGFDRKLSGFRNQTQCYSIRTHMHSESRRLKARKISRNSVSRNLESMTRAIRWA